MLTGYRIGPIKMLAIVLLAASVAQCTGSEKQSAEDSIDYQKLRMEMVTRQIEARGVTDRGVLDAMRAVERDLFVPDSLRRLAYEDYPLPIGNDQTISQPYIVALMTELIRLDKGDKVLEIGTGSGYQAAVLAELADSVFTVEIIPDLGKRAETLLGELGYSNVRVLIGDGFEGWQEHAPYDGIIVTCAPAEIPQPLLDQLAEGGRLVIPVGTQWQELMLVTKRENELSRESIIPVRFVPMTGKALQEQ